MSHARSLLDSLRGLIERTYDMASGIDDLGRFLIGDRGLRRLYPDQHAIVSVGAADGSGARTLVRETKDGTRVAVYYPDAMINRLEAYPPHRGLGDENVDAFATLVEELDHLLLIAERAASGRTVSRFELELHANVTKDLVLTRFLAGRTGRLDDGQRRWLRHHLFDGVVYREPRYRDAARWAVRFLTALGRLEAARTLSTLRRFHDVPAGDKVRLIDRLAA